VMTGKPYPASTLCRLLGPSYTALKPPPVYVLGQHAQPAPYSTSVQFPHRSIYFQVGQSQPSGNSHTLCRHTASMLQESCRSITVFAKIIWSPPLSQLTLCMILNT